MSDRPQGPVKPPQLSPNTPNAKKDAGDKKKQIIPLAILGALLLLAAILLFWMTNKDDDKPAAQQPQATSTTKGTAVPTGSSEDQQTAPKANPTGGIVKPTQTASESDAMTVAQQFIKDIASGKSGNDWAQSMKGIVTTPFYESLKGADPKSIPAGATQVTLDGGNQSTSWTGTAYDSNKKSLYKFELVTVKGSGDKPRILVKSMDIPTSGERQLDDNGYPVAPAIAPISKDEYSSIYTSALGVLKTYFEFHASNDDPKAREAQTKNAVHGGPVPPVRPVSLGTDANVQIYAPKDVHILDGNAGEQAVDGMITVYMNVSYADANQKTPKPIETLPMGVDFKWDSGTQMWKASGLRILN